MGRLYVIATPVEWEEDEGLVDPADNAERNCSWAAVRAARAEWDLVRDAERTEEVLALSDWAKARDISREMMEKNGRPYTVLCVREVSPLDFRTRAAEVPARRAPEPDDESGDGPLTQRGEAAGA